MNKKNILVTGSKGQLGSEIRELSANSQNLNFTFIDLEELDIADSSAIVNFFTNRNYDVIIHCAAYTAVDHAEDNRELASKINSASVKTLAEVARERKMRLIHISTDYVFDGEANQPIDETAVPAPLSVYGHSKLEGEQHLMQILPDAYIIRTAWVYSTFGKNFVKTIYNLARQREELSVVSDQFGSPTYARDLAQAILIILENIFDKNNDHPGIYHFSNEGAISWYDFAHFIVRYFNLNCVVKPIRTADYKTKAVRPKFSVLEKKKIRETFGITPPHWHDSLLECLKKLPDAAQQS